MISVRNILRFRRNKVALNETDLSPAKYALDEINDRASRAMARTGRTRVDVARMFGMDPGIPLAMQPPEKVPRPTMESVVKLAGFLGVSVRWLLYGEPQNDVDLFVVGKQGHHGAISQAAVKSAGHGAAIISGANNSTVVVQNIKGEISCPVEREILRIFRSLPAEKRVQVADYVFSVEKEILKKKNGPRT